MERQQLRWVAFAASVAVAAASLAVRFRRANALGTAISTATSDSGAPARLG